MVTDWRYKLQHVGDIFVDILGDVVSAARHSAAGVVVELNIRDLKKKKGRVACDIGGRVIEMHKDDPGLLTYDEQIARFYDDLENLDYTLEECRLRREARNQRFRQMFSCCSAKNEDVDIENNGISSLI